MQYAWPLSAPLYTWPPLSEPVSQPQRMKTGRTPRNPPFSMQFVPSADRDESGGVRSSATLPPHCDREHRDTQDLPQQTPQKHAHSSVTREARHFLGKGTSLLLFQASLREGRPFCSVKSLFLTVVRYTAHGGAGLPGCRDSSVQGLLYRRKDMCLIP